ncbi:hypothetical protein SRHO_G00292120 [Serrasalmus rhombeus]
MAERLCSTLRATQPAVSGPCKARAVDLVLILKGRSQGTHLRSPRKETPLRRAVWSLPFAVWSVHYAAGPMRVSGRRLAGLWPWLLAAALQAALGNAGLELAAAVEAERSAPRALIKVTVLKQEPTARPITLEGVFAGSSAGYAEGKLMQAAALPSASPRDFDSSHAPKPLPLIRYQYLCSLWSRARTFEKARCTDALAGSTSVRLAVSEGSGILAVRATKQTHGALLVKWCILGWL